MNLNHPPALVLLTHLIAEGYLTKQEDEQDWPGYHSRLPAAPDNVATVYDTTGIKDGRLMDGESIIHPGIQIRVRAKDYLTGWNKTHALRNFFDTVRRETVTIGDDTYMIHAVTLTGDIAYLGQEDKTRREGFTQNATITISGD